MINVKFEQMGLIRVIHATCTCGAEHAVECEEGVALCMEELGGCGASYRYEELQE